MSSIWVFLAMIVLSPMTWCQQESDDCGEDWPGSKARFRGMKSLCAQLRTCGEKPEEVEVHRIYSVRPEGGFATVVAVAFAGEPAQKTKVFRETDAVPDCPSISGLEASDRPQWLTSADQDELGSRLRTHCFSKSKFAGPENTFPYTTLHKIVTDRAGGVNSFSEEIVAYLLPNHPDYLAVEGQNAVQNLCTCQAPGGCGAFGQPGLAASTNLTSLLNSLKG